MKNKRLITLCMILISAFIFSSCGSQNSEGLKDVNKRINELEQKLDNMNNQISVLKQENEYLKSDIAATDHKVNISETDYKYISRRINDIEDSIFELQKNIYKKADILPVYYYDIEADKKEISRNIVIPKSMSLNDKLSLIAHKLSAVYFRYLPIEVKEIRVVDSKKIAIVNLSENEEYKRNSENYNNITWCRQYFQGSAGGNQTAVTLIDTFLQRDYEGQWIDGVQFLYENERAEFDHVGALFDIQYR